MTLKLQYDPPELKEVSLWDFVISEGKTRKKESLDDTEEEDDDI